MDELRMISTIGATDAFTLEEAWALINAHVMRKPACKGSQDLADLGYVAGVVTLNDQVEILIKFEKELLQLNKRGVTDLIDVLADG